MRRFHVAAALALLALVAATARPARAQSASPVAVRTFNDEIALVWSNLRPSGEDRLRQEAVAALGTLTYAKGGTEVSVRRLREIEIDIASPPAFERMAPDNLTLAVPGNGEWKVKVEAVVRVKQRVFGRHHWTFDVPVKLRVKKIKLVASLDVDSTTDPDRPVLKRSAPPRVKFEIDVDSSNLFYDLILEALEPTANRMAKKALDDALGKLMSSLAGLPGAAVPGAGARPYADSGAPTPFLEIVENVEKRILRDNLPHGAFLRSRMDAPAQDSWEAAYGPGGPGVQGQVSSHEGTGDSAIWSGHYLAAEAFRWKATNDPRALDTIRTVTGGIGTLLDVNGGTGLLARSAAPLASPVGQFILANGPPGRQGSINGATWIGKQGDIGITRDQYSGPFFGLPIAHDLVADPAVRAECAKRIQQMLDYLIARRWYVDEDRSNLAANPPGVPTVWLGEDQQRLAWLHAGARMVPGRYDRELARLAPLSQTAWLGLWTDAFNLERYFKFNLSQVALYNYFRLETDPARWQDLARGFRIVRRAIGHHRCPHFDAIAVAIDPSLKPVLAPSIREAVRRFAGRMHRELPTAASLNTSAIRWVTVTSPVLNVPFLPGATASGPSTVTLPAEPLDIEMQAAHGGWFQWGHSPFVVAKPGGDAFGECSGIDLVLPYWMGRHHAIFP